MNVFYDHLVNLQSLRPQLRLLLNDEAQVEEVLRELDHALHHVVMEVIFTALPSHAHENFLLQFKSDPNNARHLIFLRRYAPAIEDHIREASEQSKQKFLDTIH